MYLTSNNTILLISQSEIEKTVSQFKASLPPVYTPVDVAKFMVQIDNKLNGKVRVLGELPKTLDSRKFKVAYSENGVSKAEVVSEEAVLESLNNAQELHITKEGIHIGPEDLSYSEHFKDARDLLNYASKTVQKFDLTSAEMSVKVDDVVFSVKVTR